jgi:AcrR family transcriptional regulator
MPRPRFKKLDEDKRLQIMEAALEEFAQHGFEASSYNRIIEAVGVSKGAMYYYFDDKADLYVTTLEWLGHRKMELMGHISLDPFWEGMRAWTRKGLEFALTEPKLWRLSRDFLSLRPALLGERLEQLYEQGRAGVRGVLLQGQQQGQVRQDLSMELLVHLFMTHGEALDRWILHHVRDPDDQELETLTDHIVDTMRRLLAP